MKITIREDAMCGKTYIAPGEYVVGLSSDSGEIILTGGGRQFKLQGTRRRTKVRTRIMIVSFHSGGGTLWSLVVSTPKYGEWVASIEYASTGKK